MANSFDIYSISGLSEAEAARRLKAEGFNELPSSKRRSVLAIAWDVAREPMFLLLIACGVIYLVTPGGWHDALMLLGFVFVIMGITLYQERKTERALEALRDLSSPRALVIRGGEQKRIAGREVAREDIIVLSEGDRVPADGALLWGHNLSVDESLLTGESASVRKDTWDGKSEMARPGGDDTPFVFSGTLVVQGQGVAKVLATGAKTEIGKIGKALQTLEPEETLLQKEIKRLVRNLAILGVSICAIVAVIYGWQKSDWVEGLLAGLTLAMATLPEEFPVVLTVFLALGAWRISKSRVLTRRVPAVEMLGSATVLCVDKTGTLTLNRMTVSRLFARGRFHDLAHDAGTRLPESFHELVEFSILASQIDPFDPMEKALKTMGEGALYNTEHIHRDWNLVQEYPLSKELLAMSRVWKSPDGQDYVIAAKGAPEAIADLCHLGAREMEELARHITEMAEAGLRIIGVAKASFRITELPGEQHDFKFEFVGLLGFADPVRPGVKEAIQECYTAGIRVIMITGDYPGTARNIAGEIGLQPFDPPRRASGLRAVSPAGGETEPPVGEIVTGPELDAMDDTQLQERIRRVCIFARVVPEQKLRLVNALKADGEIVAMTGDGVNDAPALKSAHIGIAMGGRGTDVAREASALVLLDDAFPSIVEAIRMGRRVFDNLKKAMAYIFAIHVPIAGMSLIPSVLGWDLILQPVHIVFLELIIDPACSIVFEADPGEKNAMLRPPRNLKEPLFNKQTLGLSLLQGLSVLAIVMVVYAVAIGVRSLETDLTQQAALQAAIAEARALSFTTLIMANLGLILTNLSWSRSMTATLRSRNVALWWVLGLAAAFLGLVLYVPALRGLFKFGVLHAFDIIVCLLAATVSVLWLETIKHAHARPAKAA